MALGDVEEEEVIFKATANDKIPFEMGHVSSKNIDTVEGGSLRIKNALRGGHTLWTYLPDGSLVLEVTKQDLNWYEGPDELTIETYSVDGESRGKICIPDDGDESISNQIGQLQHDTLCISGLEPGAYRIELKSGDDLMVREIAINQSKLVAAKRIFGNILPGIVWCLLGQPNSGYVKGLVDVSLRSETQIIEFPICQAKAEGHVGLVLLYVPFPVAVILESNLLPGEIEQIIVQGHHVVGRGNAQIDRVAISCLKGVQAGNPYGKRPPAETQVCNPRQ